MCILSLSQSANTLKHRIQEVYSDAQKVQSDIVQVESKFRSSIYDENLLKEVSEAIRQLQEHVSKRTIGYVQKFLTQGVTAVYHDRKFDVVLEVNDRGARKTLTVFIDELKPEGFVVRSNIVDGSGGGIQVVISFLLQVLTILNQGMERVIFLDEALTAVSSEYLDGLFELINQLISTFNFRFLMISQDPRFIRFSTKTYKMKGGAVQLVS